LSSNLNSRYHNCGWVWTVQRVGGVTVSTGKREAGDVSESWVPAVMGAQILIAKKNARRTVFGMSFSRKGSVRVAQAA